MIFIYAVKSSEEIKEFPFRDIIEPLIKIQFHILYILYRYIVNASRNENNYFLVQKKFHKVKIQLTEKLLFFTK